jgi:hypothetical protein
MRSVHVFPFTLSKRHHYHELEFVVRPIAILYCRNLTLLRIA